MDPERANPTGETVAPASAKNVAVVALVAFAVLAVLNVASLTYLRAVPNNRTYWLVEQKWRKLEALAAPVDWLFLGDSSCNQGVRGDTWQSAMGGTSANVCTVAEMLAVGDAWMLERYIERHGPPKGGAVIVHVYDAWHRPAGDGFRGPLLAQVPLPWGFWNRQSPAVPLTPSDAASVLASKYLPLYSQNATLANLVLTSGWLRPPHFELDATGYMAHHEANPEAVKRDAEMHLEFVKKRKFAPSEDNIKALLRIRELAEKHRFHIYLATSPLYAELPRDPAWRRYFANVRQALERGTAGSPYLHLVLRSPVTFRADELENVDHVTHEAAATFTQALAASVKADIAFRELMEKANVAPAEAPPP